jgi:hypothetical protein
VDAGIDTPLTGRRCAGELSAAAAPLLLYAGLAAAAAALAAVEPAGKLKPAVLLMALLRMV